jgi:hypothetical protein
MPEAQRPTASPEDVLVVWTSPGQIILYTGVHFR